MSDEVKFDEGVSELFKPAKPKIPIVEKGFEGWFYKKIPGKYYIKKFILISIIIALFVASLALVALGRFNLKMQDPDSFQQRVKEAQVKQI